MEASSPFIKQLASSNPTIRNKAVETLRAYISHRTTVDELELLKLWKGLFYCMWMSDKPRNQQQLARDLADLVSVVRTETVIPFLDAFWTTMSREWMGIDVLRMDKFLYLVRVYIRAAWKRLSANNWKDADMLQQYLSLLEKIPLNPSDSKIPNGMRYHVVDLYVDELEEAGLQPDQSATTEKLLEPLRKLGKETPTKPVRSRVTEALGDARLETMLGKPAIQVEEEDDDEWDGIGA